MRVKLTSLMCGPEGSFPAGTELDVDDRKGRELVTGNYALELKPRTVETATVKPPETATTAERDAAAALDKIGAAGKKAAAPRAAGKKAE